MPCTQTLLSLQIWELCSTALHPSYKHPGRAAPLYTVSIRKTQLQINVQVIMICPALDVHSPSLPTDAVVSLIQSHLALGASRSSEAAPPSPSYSFAPHASPRFGVLVDREASHGGLFVSFKHVRQPISTPADFLKHLEVSL